MEKHDSHVQTWIKDLIRVAASVEKVIGVVVRPGWLVARRVRRKK